jgi:hypothetical protein
MTDSAISHARRILETRLRRTEYFRPELFDEHDWDLMLVLYLATVEGRTMDRNEVGRVISVREVVLDRWIAVLVAEGIVDTQAAGDGALRLTPEGLDKMQRLLSATSNA